MGVPEFARPCAFTRQRYSLWSSICSKFQSPLSWEELCGASLYQLREEGLLVSQLSKASLNSSTQAWLRLVSGLRGGGARTETEDQILINSTQKRLGSDRSSYGRKTFL